MADRYGEQFSKTLVRGLWTAYVEVAFNAASTPTLRQASYVSPSGVTFATAGSAGTRWGALTFVRNTTGDYTLTFTDKWTRILSVRHTFFAAQSPLAPIMWVKVASNPNAAAATTGMGFTGASGSASLNAVEMIFESAQGTAADPAATEFCIFRIDLLNSAAN